MDEKAPREADFDAMLDLLRPLDSDCAAVFNCQGRTEIQISPRLVNISIFSGNEMTFWRGKCGI